MPLEPLAVPQSDLNKIMQSVANLQAGVFRSTSLFKNQPKTRQMVIEPLFEVDCRILLDHIKDVFPKERVEVEKSWRRIRINLDDVTFIPGT
jgi:hypothetical protein